MKTRSPHLLTATALAASLMLAACGGGSGEAPPENLSTANADRTSPTVTITDDVAATAATGNVTFSFTFNKDVGTSFTVDDVTVTGGTKGTFTRIDGKSATLVVIPTPNSTGTIQVSVAAGAVLDALGNSSVVASSLQAYNTVPPGPAVAAAAPPARAAGDVLSVYSDTYTAVTGVNVNPDWGQATRVSEVETAGNKTLKYTALNYQGTDWSGSPINVSAMTRLHLDVWTADVTSLKVSVISAGKENAVTLTPTLSGWNSFDIDMAQFTAADKTAVIQLKIEGTPSGTVYLDNIYFWKPAAATTSNDLTLASFDEAPALPFAGFDGGEGSALDAAPPAGGGTGKALKVFRSGGQVWAGAKVNVGVIPLTASNRTISARVYSPTAGVPMVLKLENITDSGINTGDIQATQAVVAGWQTLTWVVPEGKVGPQYSWAVLLPNLDTRASVSPGETYFFEDLKLMRPAAAAGTSLTTFDEAPALPFAGFDGGEGSTIDAAPPSGGSGKAMKVFRSGGQVWAGAKVNVGVIPLTATDRTISARVYSPTAGLPMVLKLENLTNADINSGDMQATQAVVAGWQTLTWVVPADKVGQQYSWVVMLPNLATKASVSPGETYYFDDIRSSAAAAATGGGSGGGGTPGVGMGAGGPQTLTLATGDVKTGDGGNTMFVAGEGLFAVNYVGSAEAAAPFNLAAWPNARSANFGSITGIAGGDIGYFQDDANLSNSSQKVDELGWITGTSYAPNGVPNFFRTFVLKGAVATGAYMGLYVNAPNNGTVNVSNFSKLKIKLWGPGPMFERTNLNPVVEITLVGPKVAGCTTGSGGSEITQNLTANRKDGAGGFYTLPLSAFTVKTLCTGDTSAASVLAKLARVVVTVPGTSFNYTNLDGGNYATGVNLGPVGFTNN